MYISASGVVLSTQPTPFILPPLLRTLQPTTEATISLPFITVSVQNLAPNVVSFTGRRRRGQQQNTLGGVNFNEQCSSEDDNLSNSIESADSDSEDGLEQTDHQIPNDAANEERLGNSNRLQGLINSEQPDRELLTSSEETDTSSEETDTSSEEIRSQHKEEEQAEEYLHRNLEEEELEEYLEDQEDQAFDDGVFWALWRNITISRDQTNGSSYEQDKLAALRETQTHTHGFDSTTKADSLGLIASGSIDHTVKIWNPATGQCIQTLEDTEKIWAVCWSPDGSRFAYGSAGGALKIWDSVTWQCVFTLNAHSKGLRSLTWSPDSNQLASASEDHTVKIWDQATGQCIQTLECHINAVVTVSWSPDGSQLASGSFDETVKIWDPSTGQCIQTLEGHIVTVESISWSPDSAQLASGSFDETVKIWDPASGQCIQTLTSRTYVRAIAWSPNSRQLASGLDDGTLMIWDSATWQTIATIDAYHTVIGSIAWSPDSSHLVLGAHDKTVKIWDLSTGSCKLTLRGHENWAICAEWTAHSVHGHIDQHKQAVGSSRGFQKNSPISAGSVISRPFALGFSPCSKGGLLLPNHLDSATYLKPQSADLDPAMASPDEVDKSHIPLEILDCPETFENSVSHMHQNNSDHNEAHCRLKDASTPDMDHMTAQQMIQRISRLEEENNKLKGVARRYETGTYQIFHKIEGDNTTYLSEPSWTFERGGAVDLRGHSPVPDVDGYLDHRPEVSFTIYKHYTLEHQKSILEKARAERNALPDPKPALENIKLLSEDMVEAARAFCQAQPDFDQDFPDWDPTNIPSPFLFWYHYRDNGTVDTLSQPRKSLMKLLGEWIETSYGEIYSQVKDQFSRGVVSSAAMPFFIRPHDVLVSTQGMVVQGYAALSWARKIVTPTLYDEPSSIQDIKKKSEMWHVKAWSYGYDGQFYRYNSDINILLKFDEEHPEVNINSLETFPARYAGTEINTLLDRRGEITWKCRYRKLVSYEDNKQHGLYGPGERFMIDFATYKQLHADSPKFKRAYPHLTKRDRKGIDIETMKSETPPPSPHRLIFPSTIIGYNLRQKKWMDLQVDKIREVSWNTDAFNHLVVEEEIKLLIRALVSSKLEEDQGTDVIEGKGNGLIILLHGGPGTGKTFTAESVAEIAKKPLYRVTCGDIGTQPQEVEKYLESVLYLGKMWDCVVLLDEADVFLEQRTLTDLERNALVSVFLRVLEYYDGILILTSNRVGTFDEAFKSRIQVSLHYEDLKKQQRSAIWKNFLTRMKTLEDGAARQKKREAIADAREDDGNGLDRQNTSDQQPARIDFADIEQHIEELAKVKMNGRQIRNVITTARQLANYEHRPMSYSHMKRVMKILSKFEEYLKKVSGNTDEEAAREDGRR